MNAMKLVLLFAVLLFAGCASLHDPAKPITAAEEFPLRNQDPRTGLLVNTGTAPSNLFVYDQGNRLVEQIYLSGASRFMMGANGQPIPQYWTRKFEPGCYRIDAFPFYKALSLFPPMEYRVDLPKQMYNVCVSNNPSGYYYGGRHWGWLLYIGANIPEGGGVGSGNAFPALIKIINPFQ